MTIEQNILKDERNILRAEKEDLQRRYLAECSVTRDLRHSLSSPVGSGSSSSHNYGNDSTLPHISPSALKVLTPSVLLSQTVPHTGSGTSPGPYPYPVTPTTTATNNATGTGMASPSYPDSSLGLALRAALEEGTYSTLHQQDSLYQHIFFTFSYLRLHSRLCRYFYF